MKSLLIIFLLIFSVTVTLPAWAADTQTGSSDKVQMQAKPNEPADPFE